MYTKIKYYSTIKLKNRVKLKNLTGSPKKRDKDYLGSAGRNNQGGFKNFKAKNHKIKKKVVTN